MSKKFWTLTVLILGAALSRLLPHPANFTPILALGLFAGAQFDSKKLSLVIPLLAMLISDALLGFHDQMIPVYASVALIVAMGWNLQGNDSKLRLVAPTLWSSILFFVVTNFGVWALTGFYSKDMTGLVTCFTLGLPFFPATLASTVIYTIALFGGLWLIESKTELLRT
jgi:hypothetical protein